MWVETQEQQQQGCSRVAVSCLSSSTEVPRTYLACQGGDKRAECAVVFE